MDTSDKILELNGLTVAFGDRTVVCDVNYTLYRGKTLGIVGESGSGKSVSSLALMGLLSQKAKVTGHAWLSPAQSDLSDQSDKSDKFSLPPPPSQDTAHWSLVTTLPSTYSPSPTRSCATTAATTSR